MVAYALTQTVFRLISRAFIGLRANVPEARVPLKPKRRKGCRYYLPRFIRVYFPYLRELNRFQEKFAIDLQTMILSGAPLKQLKAIAAPRGGGKSTICQLAILWAAIHGHVKFVLMLGANGDKAKERIASIKEYVFNNDLLAEDFPEICRAVRDFSGDPRRAPPAYPWATLEIRFANGVWITAAGIDGAIAGALRGDDRPDLIILDDIEAGIDVDSEAESHKLRKRLQEALAITPQQGTSTIVYICTLKSQDCLSSELTDAKQNPVWRGERYRALERPPVREDLWDAFMGILRPSERTGRFDQIKDAVKPDQLTDEQIAKALGFPLDAYQKLEDEHKQAYAFYVANQEAMNEVAVVLDADSMPLRRIYEERAVLGEDYFRCELQNDPPPPPDKLQALQMEALQARSLPYLPARVIPLWGDVVLVTCDVGLRAIHWEVSAWSLSRECSVVIDCGITSTGLGIDGSWDLAPENSKASLMERGIRSGLDKVFMETRDAYAKIDSGEIVNPYGAVDMGGGMGVAIEEGDAAWSRVVIAWCAAKAGRWFAVRGAPSWTEGLRKLASDGNWVANERGFVAFHTDYYKTRLYNALQTPLFSEEKKLRLPSVGSRAFNADIPDGYLRQMMSEERSSKGKWVQVARQNHFWDCAYMNIGLADMLRHRNPKPNRRRVEVNRPKWGKPIRRKF